MEPALADLPRGFDSFDLAFHAFDLEGREAERALDEAPSPVPRFVWAARASEVIVLPSVMIDEALLMDDWFFTEVVADDDDFAQDTRPRDVTRWLVMAGAVSSLLVALLTLTV